MKCTSCGWDNSDGSMYCEGCGCAIDATSASLKRNPTEQRTPRQRKMTSEMEAPPVSASAVRLRIVRGGSKGRIFPLEQGSNLLGRWDPDTGSFPEVDLEAEDLEAKISRKHAVIECKGTRAVLRDIGSLNGTFVNRGARLEEGQEVALKSGDEVIIGKTFLRFEVGPFEEES